MMNFHNLVSDMGEPVNNRKVGSGMVFLSGLAAGVVIYLFAECLTPKNVASPGDHDILLADRLGFIYTPLVGLWLGWLQRSWRRAIAGALVGVGIGRHTPVRYSRLSARGQP